MEEKNLYHLHLLVKARISNPPSDEAQLTDWLGELVEAIGMKTMMGPYAKYLDVQGNRGITGAVVIETSHISIHVWDEPNPAMVQMDVYSCANFEPETVLEKLKEFGLMTAELMLIDRNDVFEVTRAERLNFSPQFGVVKQPQNYAANQSASFL